MQKNKLEKGFTLVELIAVMAIFLLVAGAAMTILIGVIQHQRRLLAEQQILSQISCAEEYISKALGMAKTQEDETCLTDSEENGLAGYIYLLTHYDAALGIYKGIKFINQSADDLCQEFFLDNAEPGNSASPLVLYEKKAEADPAPITSAGMQINFGRFSVNGLDGSALACVDSPDKCGATSSDSNQPRVTMVLNVNVPGSSQEPVRTIQTTVSQRNLNAK